MIFFIYVCMVYLENLNSNKNMKNIFDNLSDSEGSNSNNSSDLTADENSSNVKSSKGYNV